MSRVTRGIRVPGIAAILAAVCFGFLGFGTPLAESGSVLPGRVKEKLSSPLTERDCVALALEFSYAMQKSEYDVKRAKSTHLTSVSAFLPNVSMGSGFQRRVTGPTDYSFFDPTSGRLITGLTEAKTNDTWYLDFSVRQNLINLSDWADLGQARNLLNSARMGYENWRQETEYIVVAQFYSLVKAIKLAEAMRAADPDAPPASVANELDTLAAAYAELGRFEEAIRAAERAVQIMRQLGGESEARAFEERLQLYRRRQPYRESAGR